jgi:hypothetical protein
LQNKDEEGDQISMGWDVEIAVLTNTSFENENTLLFQADYKKMPLQSDEGEETHIEKYSNHYASVFIGNSCITE